MSYPSRIAFGSCNDQDRPNLLWPTIVQRNPAAFVWAGDAIYAGECCNCFLRSLFCLLSLGGDKNFGIALARSVCGCVGWLKIMGLVSLMSLFF